MTLRDERRPENIEAIAAATAAQQGILFHSLRCRDRDPYFNHWVGELAGALDVAALQAAWQSAVDRHQVLRAEFRWEETATPLLMIFKRRAVALDVLDYRGASESEQRRRLRALLSERHARGYDFRRSSELKLVLIQVAPERHWLVWDHHHITLDGWSISLVLADVLNAYQSRTQGNAQRLADAPAFTSYVAWLEQQDRVQALAHYTQVLAGFDPPTALPRASLGDGAGYAELTLELTSEESASLQRRAQALGVTQSTFMQGVWALLLGRHANQRDVVFGVTVSGRAEGPPGVESCVGLFVNTLPVRVRLEAARSVQSFLLGIQAQNLESRSSEYVPLGDIRRALGLPGEQPLFETAVVFENYPLARAAEGPTGLTVERLLECEEDGEASETTGRNNYPLSLIVVPGTNMRLTLAYQRERFDAAGIAELGAQLRHLLGVLGEHAEQALGALGLLPRAAVSSAPPLPVAPTVLEAFAARVAEKPDAAAVRTEELVWSYAALDAAADAVAAELARRGLRAEQNVGVCAERGIGFVAALLGVLKAGAAYVPIDERTPPARVAELVREGGVQVLLTSARSASRFTELPCAVLSLEPLFELRAEAPVLAAVHPEQAAYVIFTSGSTGRPKGVVVSHRALGRYVHGMLAELRFPPGASMAMVSTIGADLGHTTLFGALCSGVELHLISEARAFDPDAFAEYMERHEVGVLKIVPSHLRALLEARHAERVLPADVLVLGGEASDFALLERIRRLRPGCRIVNHYGPTETTVGVCTHEPVPERDQTTTVPIGRGLPGVELHVLDLDLNPVPSGVVAELYVGGDRLARGYLASPRLTAERFVPDPFATNGGRLYRTGDRVRSSRGLLEFIGRADRQLKIRGYRVELGEIEAHLLAHPAVREAVVVARALASGSQQLEGYVVVGGEGGESSETLLASLRARLPEHMVPSRLCVLDRLPLTPNGKLDRAALPAESTEPVPRDSEPTTAAEQKLIEVWQQVLKVERVRVVDNFFALGGDSILSLQVIARARRQGLRITPQQIFEHPTLRALAAAVTPAEPRAVAGVARAPRRIALLPAQARWFARHHAHEPWGGQVWAFRAKETLAPAALEQALGQLRAQHRALGYQFARAESGEWFAFDPERAPPRGASLWLRAVASENDLAGLAREAEQSLDPERGDLLRAALVQLQDGVQVLLIALHRLVADAGAWSVLLLELDAAYQQASKSVAPASEPAVSFEAWSGAFWQRYGGGATEEERGYFGAELGEPDPEPPSPAEQELRTATATLGERATADLLRGATQAYCAEPDHALLAALGRALCRWLGSSSVVVSMEEPRRPELFDGLDSRRCIGWVAQPHPVCLRPELGASARDRTGALVTVKEQLRRVPGHGAAYLVLQHAEGAVREPARWASVGVSFTGLDPLFMLVGAPSERIFLPWQRLSSARASCGAVLGFEHVLIRGELRVSAQYSTRRHSSESIQCLLADYVSELAELAALCAGARPGQLSPSDVHGGGLGQRELDNLLESLEPA